MGWPSPPQISSFPAVTRNPQSPLPTVPRNHALQQGHAARPLREAGRDSQRAGAPRAYRPPSQTPPRRSRWAQADALGGCQDDPKVPVLLHTYRWKETGIRRSATTSLSCYSIELLRGKPRARPEGLCGAAPSSFPDRARASTQHNSRPTQPLGAQGQGDSRLSSRGRAEAPQHNVMGLAIPPESLCENRWGKTPASEQEMHCLDS